MNTLLKKYRLLLALTAGFLVLALQCAGASSAFARGLAASGVTHTTGALTATTDPCSAAHASCDSAGYAATNNSTTSYSYHEASFIFTVPTITGANGAYVFFDAGLGGFVGTAPVHVFVAVTSYINSGTQKNYAWYGISNQGSWSLTGFPRAIAAGDQIILDVRSNLHGVGDDKFFVTDANMNHGQGATLEGIVSGNFSDGRTGECMVSRVAGVSIANFGTVSFTDCHIATNTDSQYVGSWPNTYYHLVNDSSGVILVRVGTLDSFGDFTVIWERAS